MSKECDVIGHVPVCPDHPKSMTLLVQYGDSHPYTYNVEICRFCNALFVIKKNVNKGVEE